MTPPTNPKDLPPEWHDHWAERVAIMVVDGRQRESEARLRALVEVVELMRLNGEIA